MTLSEICRARATDLAERAKSAPSPVFKERLKRMALSYERLAEKYARRARTKPLEVSKDGSLRSNLTARARPRY